MVNVRIEGAMKIDNTIIARIKRGAIGRPLFGTDGKLELIKLRHTGTPGQLGATLRPKGFQDVTIIRVHGTNEIRIELGDPGAGALELIGNDVGEFEGELPKTEHNLKMLAAHHYLYRNKVRWYLYDDPAIEDEIEQIANEARKNRTQEQIESDKRMEWDIDHTPSERKPISKKEAMEIVTGKISPEQAAEKLVASGTQLDTEKRLLELEVQKLREEKERLTGKEPETEIDEDTPIEEMTRKQLQKTCKKAGIRSYPTDTNRRLLEKIRSHRENKADDKPPSPEGEHVHKTGVAGSS
jgi:hypothetical protein